MVVDDNESLRRFTAMLLKAGSMLRRKKMANKQ